MYYPHEPEEPGGCAQTLMISRAIFQILAVPIAVIGGVMFFVGFSFYLFTVNTALVLIPIAIGAAAVWGFSQWEKRRIERQMMEGKTGREDDD